MTNFRHEESMAPAGDEAIGAIANDVAWTRVQHPTLGVITFVSRRHPVRFRHGTGHVRLGEWNALAD